MLGLLIDRNKQIAFLLFDLVSMFINTLFNFIMHILSSTRLIISFIVKLCESCHCAYTGVFRLTFEFLTNENTVNNNTDDDYLNANNNPNTNSNNNNISKDNYGASVRSVHTIILITNTSFVNNEKHRKHMHSSVTYTSATTTAHGNCTNSPTNNSINTLNGNINNTNHGGNILTKMGCLASTSTTVNSNLSLNHSGFATATLCVLALTSGTYASIRITGSVHSGNKSVNEAEQSCDLLLTIVSFSGILSTISTVFEICTKGNTIAKQKQKGKKWFDTENTRDFPNTFPKNSIVNSMIQDTTVILTIKIHQR